MKTVRIYRQTCTNSYMMSEQGECFDLQPWGDDTDVIKGYDDGGKDYQLPEGYEVCELKHGGQGIFLRDHYCDIETHSSGRPQLYTPHTSSRPVLTPV